MKKRIAAMIIAGSLAAGLMTGCAENVSAVGNGTPTESGGSGDETATSSDNTITVSGTGKVTVVPDTAQISLGVQTVDTSTKAAQAENTKTVNAVIAALEKAGVEEKNITTSSLDIYANYDYSGYGSGELTGYTVSTTLTLQNLKVSDVGSLIDTATDAGVNQVNGISYSYSDSVTAYDQAMDAALDRAEEKAQKIADKVGKTLGDVKTVEENGSSYDTPLDTASYSGSAAEDSSMKVLAGETDVSATVEVTYYCN